MRAVIALALACGAPVRCGGALRYLSSYDYDPAAQAGWLTLGKTDNLTLLVEGWKKYRIPALIELSQGGGDSLWCANSTGSLIPCGGRGSATFAARLAAFGAKVRPHLASGACRGAFLGDELMAAVPTATSQHPRLLFQLVENKRARMCRSVSGCCAFCPMSTMNWSSKR